MFLWSKALKTSKLWREVLLEEWTAPGAGTELSKLSSHVRIWHCIPSWVMGPCALRMRELQQHTPVTWGHRGHLASLELGKVPQFLQHWLAWKCCCEHLQLQDADNIWAHRWHMQHALMCFTIGAWGWIIQGVTSVGATWMRCSKTATLVGLPYSTLAQWPYSTQFKFLPFTYVLI